MTIDDLVNQLDHALQIAIEDRKPTAMIQATMAQAKLLGLDTGIKDVSPDDDIKCGLGWFYGERELTPEVAKAISNQLDEEYL